jgi:hypothetical protein
MHRADKAVLRLAIGLGLAVLIAYGFALPLPFAVCLMAVLLLCSPAPPMPLLKGVVVGGIVTCLLVAGVLMVPLLEHYPVTGVLLTGIVLFALFFAGARSASPLITFMVAAFTFIPVAGVAEQSLAIALAQAVGVGLVVGALVNGLSHTFFPDAPAPAGTAPPPAIVDFDTARWQAVQATVVVMPVFVIALSNPALYIAAIMKTVLLGQQAGGTNARSAGRELVGSTLMGALMAMVVWFGLTLLPSLWMLMLWIVAAALWSGGRLFRVQPSRFAPSFWLNALMTMFILLGPAIEDAAVGKDPYAASATRVTLFIVVSLYAWATVWALERWRSSAVAVDADQSVTQ